MIMCAVLILASGSRTSLVGLAGAGIWVFFSRKSFGDALRIAASTVILGIGILFVSSKVSLTAAQLFSSDFQHQAVHTFYVGTQRDESSLYRPLGAPLSGYVANVLSRFWYWGIAIGLWLKNPIFGIGSFRYNDIQISYSGWHGVAEFATSGIDNSKVVEGAHNQFLGILAENGLVGLALFFVVWFGLYRLAARAWTKPRPIRESACQLVTFAFATSLTGNTMNSPALTFVTLTWICLVVAAEMDLQPVVQGQAPRTPSKKSRRGSR